jgi:hypothetical protein
LVKNLKNNTVVLSAHFAKKRVQLNRHKQTTPLKQMSVFDEFYACRKLVMMGQVQVPVPVPVQVKETMGQRLARRRAEKAIHPPPVHYNTHVLAFKELEHAHMGRLARMFGEHPCASRVEMHEFPKSEQDNFNLRGLNDDETSIVYNEHWGVSAEA